MSGASEEDGRVDGTQAIRRAAAILRLIGHEGAQGVSLAKIAEVMRLPRSTAHRILKCLVDEGLVRHEKALRRYVVGRLVYELGLTVTAETLEIARWRGAVARVASRTGATAYLMGRSGIEATCLLKEDGTSVIRVIPVDIGQRRFLGVGAGSTALLAALDPDTSEAMIRTITPLLGSYPNLTVDVIRENVAKARQTGIVVSRSNVVRDVIGIGKAIPSPPGMPASLSLSIAALASQTTDAMVEDWKRIITEEVQAGPDPAPKSLANSPVAVEPGGRT